MSRPASHKLSSMMFRLSKNRDDLYRQWHRYTGLPTLDYDEIVENIECKIIDAEAMLTHTCCGCGGERLLYTCDEDRPGVHVPENGLCLMEIDECQSCVTWYNSCECEGGDGHE